MNKKTTLADVRSVAMDTIAKLNSGELDIKTARSVKELLDTVIDTAKTEVEYLKAIPNSIKEQMNEVQIKAIASSLRDKDAELDISLAEIEKRRKTPYEFDKK